MIDPNTYLATKSDEELLEYVEELKKTTLEDNSPLRLLIKHLYGDDRFFILRYMELYPPLLMVISERMKCYSPHISK